MSAFLIGLKRVNVSTLFSSHAMTRRTFGKLIGVSATALLPLLQPVSATASAGEPDTPTADIPPSTWGDIGVVAGFIVLALGLGAATLRRRTA